MAEHEWVTRSEDETIGLGRELGARLKAPALVLLTGELGAGKTTLAKGLVAGLGAAREEEVTSPTFTLVHLFHNHSKVYHVDLYRVGSARDFETLGLDEVLAETAVVIVEWAEKFLLSSDWPMIRIRLEHVDERSRRIALEDAGGVLGELA